VSQTLGEEQPTMRIELDETPQALSVTFSQTFLRMLLGGVALWHGTQKLAYPGPLEAQLSHLGVPDADVFTTVVFSLELAAGVALVLGRFTRTAAFVLLCDALLSAALLYLTHAFNADSMAFEALALICGACTLFVVVGSGPFGADYALRRRARLRAIANDELWNRPPYVA
jgi:uncharacterized membrane protein YphA (DoxX/SURF4 family)